MQSSTSASREERKPSATVFARLLSMQSATREHA
jgi:hypothetical protein